MKTFKRIDENTFKLEEAPHKMSHEEVVAAWEDDKNGEYVCVMPDENKAYYVAHGVGMEEIPSRSDDIWSGINVWMSAKGFFPNIWSTNDHGNQTLWDKRGNDLGGLV